MGTRGSVDKDTILFDGVCNMCNSSVNFVIDRDKKGRYQFASLQSDNAKEILSEKEVKLESIVLITADGRILKKSNAALEIARHLSGAWFLLYAFKILPRFFRDWIYDWVARNRYKWFGKRDTCRMPSPELKERFLEAS